MMVIFATGAEWVLEGFSPEFPSDLLQSHDYFLQYQQLHLLALRLAFFRFVTCPYLLPYIGENFTAYR